MPVCSFSVTYTHPYANSVQKFYPIRLADKSWDNTGLLVDSSYDEDCNEIRVLLTIDLTRAVAEEAVQSKSNIIMAYHPFIFRGLKSITPQDPQQRSLIQLIQNKISVYSPHTAVDSAKGGVNDFLARDIALGAQLASKDVIQPDSQDPDCGMGRLIRFESPVGLEQLVENVKKSLGLKYVQVALGAGNDKNHKISTVAICAGSGGSVFRGVEADLYFTGELSHHEALYFKEQGSSVIACSHSNTERAFLADLKTQLQLELPSATISISQCDRDPYETW